MIYDLNATKAHLASPHQQRPHTAESAARIQRRPCRAFVPTQAARLRLREDVRDMFYHGYNNYMTSAFPLDELRLSGRRTFSPDARGWGPLPLNLLLAHLNNHAPHSQHAKQTHNNSFAGATLKSGPHPDSL